EEGGHETARAGLQKIGCTRATTAEQAGDVAERVDVEVRVVDERHQVRCAVGGSALLRDRTEDPRQERAQGSLRGGRRFAKECASQFREVTTQRVLGERQEISVHGGTPSFEFRLKGRAASRLALLRVKFMT